MRRNLSPHFRTRLWTGGLISTATSQIMGGRPITFTIGLVLLCWCALTDDDDDG